ncbi:MAG: hypothetical protein FWB75_04955 [Oscillospiraceae bacterium]|nr:hypothetical protein [Oscillospiraceae bacterium]
MKTMRSFLVVMILTLMLISGCSEITVQNSGQRENTSQIGSSAETEGAEIRSSPSIPTPFVVQNVGDLIGFLSAINAQEPLSETQMFSENGVDEFYSAFLTESNRMAYDFHNIAYLTEFYSINVEIEGFELTELHIDRHNVAYIFRCNDVREWGERVSIALRRHRGDGFTPDEVWQIISEQALRSGGVVTELGMLYNSNLNEMLSRIGDTYLIIRVPDRLNSYEFLRDLALEVIATSELIVLEDILAEPVVPGVEVNPPELTLCRDFNHTSGSAEVAAHVPSPLRIQNPGNLIDFRNEIITRLTQSEAVGLSGTEAASSMMAFEANDIVPLSEIYFVTVEIDGFELREIEVSKSSVRYSFRCIEVRDWGDEILIAIQRPSRYYSPGEVWQIVTEQLTREGRGRTTDDGMIYESDISRISAMMGDTRIIIRVPDRLNSYEFLRDLALEVIATSELIVLDDILAEPIRD